MLIRNYSKVLVALSLCLSGISMADNRMTNMRDGSVQQSYYSGELSEQELHRQRMQELEDWKKLEELARRDQQYYNGASLAQSVFKDTPRR